jgi:hypothetical protein
LAMRKHHLDDSSFSRTAFNSAGTVCQPGRYY